jgi:hypothetical protein
MFEKLELKFSIKLGDVVEIKAPNRLHYTFNELNAFPMLYCESPASIWYDKNLIGIIIEIRPVVTIFGGGTQAIRILTPLGIGWTGSGAIEIIHILQNIGLDDD